MNRKMIPSFEKATTNGHLKLTGQKMVVLQEAIDRLKNGTSTHEEVNISYSLPAPKSIFPASYIIDGQTKTIAHRVKDIELDTKARLTVADVHRTFQLAFYEYKALLEHDVKGLKLNLRLYSNGYERQPRSITHYDEDRIAVGEENYRAGDINIIFIPIPLVSRNANGFGEYRTRIGETTNSGLVIAFNSSRYFVLDEDPHIYGYPTADQVIRQEWGTAFRTTMTHELGHLFGVGHIPYPKSDDINELRGKIHSFARIPPTIMNASTRPATPYKYWWPNGLWKDAYLRSALAMCYGYSLDHTVIERV